MFFGTSFIDRNSGEHMYDSIEQVEIVSEPRTRARRRKRGTPSHVARFRLDTMPPRQDLVLMVRGRASDCTHNAYFTEVLTRLENFRAYSRCEQVNPVLSCKARTESFSAPYEQYGFSESVLISHVSGVYRHLVRDLVDDQEAHFRGAERVWNPGPLEPGGCQAHTQCPFVDVIETLR